MNLLNFGRYLQVKTIWFWYSQISISYSKLTKSMWFCQSLSSSFITVIIFIEITTILTKKKYFDTGVDRPWRPIFCRWRESLSQDCLDRYHGMFGEGKIFISIINNQLKIIDQYHGMLGEKLNKMVSW